MSTQVWLGLGSFGVRVVRGLLPWSLALGLVIGGCGSSATEGDAGTDASGDAGSDAGLGDAGADGSIGGSLTLASIDLSDAQAFEPGAAAQLTATVSGDAGVTRTITIDWGDDTTTDVGAVSAGTNLDESHQYTALGAYSVTASICDGAICMDVSLGAVGVACAEAGFDDCGGGIADGCETNTMIDPLHCGGCEFACDATDSVCDSADTCAAGQCQANFASVETECRPAAGVCDSAEFCDGLGGCPEDTVATPDEVCRAAAGDCDAPETCDGENVDCPSDDKLGTAVVCRAAQGVCDVAEQCDGVGNACPADAKEPTSTECRPSAGVCDAAELCDGASNGCPGDTRLGPATTCRAANGVCDVAEVCDGINAACPSDAKEMAGTECRASGGVCDVAEACDGLNNACPSDAKVTAGTECRASAGVCDVVEKCDGSSNACPLDQFAMAGLVCRADSDGVAPSGDCDAAEKCTGASASCPADVNEDAGTTCMDTGTCSAGGSCEVAEPSGSLDTSFGTGGLFQQDLGGDSDELWGVHVIDNGPDAGKIIVSGMRRNASYDFLLGRLTSAGAPDASFQSSGWRVHDIDGTDRAWAGLAVYENAGGVTRIVLAGESGDYGALAAYTASGAIDTTFGSAGLAVPSIPGALFSTPWGLAVQGDGSLLVGSEYYVSNFQPILMRFTAAGVQDATFGSGGRVFPAPFSATELYSYPVWDPVNSRIYFSNWQELGSDDDFNTHAFDTSGNAVSAFSGDGRTSLDIALSDATSQDSSTAIAVDSAGRVLVVGSWEPRPSKTFLDDFFVVRYTSSGVLDTSFSGDGIFLYDNGDREVPAAVEIQADGKIIVAGRSGGQWLIIRVNSDGTLDTGFGTNGKVTAFSGNSNTTARAIDIQADGKIVIAGTVGNASRDVGVVRLHP